MIMAIHTWTEKTTPNPGDVPWTIAYNQGRIFLGTSGGLLVSDNDGTSWTQKVVFSSQVASGFAFCNQQVFLSDYSAGVFGSVDNGNTWTALSAGFDFYQHLHSIVIHDGEVLVAASPNIYGMNYSCVLASDVEGISVSSKNIYPNPASSFLNLRIGTLPASVVIFDMQGREVKKIISNENAPIDISSLSCGAYVIQYQNDDRLIRNRFIKQ